VPARIDTILAIILGIAAVVSPLALGATFPVARFALEATLATVIVVWASSRRRSPLALVLPVAIFCLAWLQLAPLPDSLLVSLAPISGAAWKLANGADPAAWGCISVDPAASAAGAQRLLIGVATVLVVRDLATSTPLRHGLMAAVAISSAVIWTLGLVFPRETKDDLLLGFVDLTGPIDFWVSPILAPVESAGAANVNVVTVGPWRYPVADGLVGDGYGPFISSNQFAGGLCIGLPLVVAFWLVGARRKLPDWAAAAGALLLAAGGVVTAGVLAGSRAGGAALVLGSIAFLTLTARTRWWRWTLVAGTAVIATGLLAFAAAVFGVIPDAETLLPEPLRPTVAKLLTDNRSVAIRVGLRMVRASPVAGTGLDSYGEVFPRFVPGQASIFYAHNDYLEWVAETGLVGGLLAAVLAGLLIRRGRRWYDGREGVDRVLAAGAVAGAIGFGSHEVFEWNLHVPAIALMASILVGLCAPATIGGRTRDGGRDSLRAAAAVVLVAAVVASLGFLARDMVIDRTTAGMRAALAADRLAMRDPTQPSAVPALEAAIGRGERAAEIDPATADLPLLLGQLHLHLAAREPDDEARAILEQAAEAWFNRAKRRRAICFGLPEQVPEPVRRPAP